jgi:uncharacterized protein DUF3592
VRRLSPFQYFLTSWALGGLATVVGLAVLTGLVLKDHGWWGYLRLVNAGVTTRAVVVRTDRGNHCLAEYSFATEGQTYRGSGADCSVRVGESVTITYLPSDPRHSCIRLARDALENELTAFAIGGVIFPPFVLFVVRQWTRRRRATSTVA